MKNMADTFMQVLFQYFNSINAAKSFKSFASMIFNDEALPLEGRYVDDIKHDTIPYLDWLDENNKNVISNKIDYYQTDLFEMVKIHNSGNFKPFFETLKEGLEIFLDEKYVHPRKKSLYYSKEAVSRLCKHFDFQANYITIGKKQNEIFAYSLYTSLYFVSKGYICQQYSEIVNGLELDREEFNAEVLSKYGCSGRPGVYAIYNLADRETPNVVALYEAAELEYYGKGFSKNPDYQKAYDYYKKAVENPRAYNPLAGWSLGYMFYYYKNPEKELKDAYIPEIDSMTVTDRKARSLQILKMSFNCGCPAAANVIAAIVDDDDVPDIYKCNLKTSEEYLIIAANSNYVYAKNNLFDLYENRALKAESIEKKRELTEKAYSYLKESVDLGEPWAINKYASHLFDIGSIDTAFSYFKKAAYKLNDWASYNLLEKYYFPSIIRNDTSLIYPDSIDMDFVNLLVKRCLASKNPKIKNKTEELLKDNDYGI